MVKVRVEYYATLREVVGVREGHVELPPGSTLRDLLRAIEGRWGASWAR